MPSKQVSSQKTRLSPAAMVLLGEAAGEWPNGMAMVRDVMVNRAKRMKTTLDAVATQPKQFSAYARPDLQQFVENQPPMIQDLAQQLIDEGSQPDYQSKYPGVENYITRTLYENRFSPHVPSWIQQMDVAGHVGNHVLLIKRAKR